MSPSPNHLHSKHDTWILVCDGTHAKMYVNHGPKDGVHQVSEKEIKIPRVRDIVTSDRGRNQAPGNQTENHAYDQPNPRRVEKEHFLKHVAQAVNDNNGAIERLIVAAPPQALHILREELSPHIRKKILCEIDKNLTKCDELTLPQFLTDHMNLQDPKEKFNPERVRIVPPPTV